MEQGNEVLAEIVEQKSLECRSCRTGFLFSGLTSGVLLEYVIPAEAGIQCAKLMVSVEELWYKK